jgi:predicted AAA+ superfamily ATPase
MKEKILKVIDEKLMMFCDDFDFRGTQNEKKYSATAYISAL